MSDYEGQRQVVYVGLAVIFTAVVIWFSFGNDSPLKAAPPTSPPAAQAVPTALDDPWADIG